MTKYKLMPINIFCMIINLEYLKSVTTCFTICWLSDFVGKHVRSVVTERGRDSLPDVGYI